VHTIYCWPRPRATITEIHRVLQAGGRLVLALHAGEHALSARFDRAVYSVLTTSTVTSG
jgi:ubiquinone/menaquinone biosynthesis C-methylase UbiE